MPWLVCVLANVENDHFFPSRGTLGSEVFVRTCKHCTKSPGVFKSGRARDKRTGTIFRTYARSWSDYQARFEVQPPALCRKPRRMIAHRGRHKRANFAGHFCRGGGLDLTPSPCTPRKWCPQQTSSLFSFNLQNGWRAFRAFSSRLGPEYNFGFAAWKEEVAQRCSEPTSKRVRIWEDCNVLIGATYHHSGRRVHPVTPSEPQEERGRASLSTPSKKQRIIVRNSGKISSLLAS